MNYIKSGDNSMLCTPMKEVFANRLDLMNKIVDDCLTSTSGITKVPKNTIMHFSSFANESFTYEDIYVGSKLNKGKLVTEVNSLLDAGRKIAKKKGIESSELTEGSYVSVTDVEGDGEHANLVMVFSDDLVMGVLSLRTLEFAETPDVIKYKEEFSEIRTHLVKIIELVASINKNICSIDIHPLHDGLLLEGYKGKDLYVGVKRGIPSSYEDSMEPNNDVFSLGLFI